MQLSFDFNFQDYLSNSVRSLPGVRFFPFHMLISRDAMQQFNDPGFRLFVGSVLG